MFLCYYSEVHHKKFNYLICNKKHVDTGFSRQTLYFRYVPLNGTSEYVRLFSQAFTFSQSIFTQLLACCLPHSFWIMLFSPQSFKTYQLLHISCTWKWGWNPYYLLCCRAGHLLFMCISADFFWQESALPLPEKQDRGIQATVEKQANPTITCLTDHNNFLAVKINIWVSRKVKEMDSILEWKGNRVLNEKW